MIWRSTDSRWVKASLTSLDLMVTTVYSYFVDKVMNQEKPDKYSWISSICFAIAWFSLSRLTHFGFEVDLRNFFCGTLIAQLMKISPWLFFAGACGSNCLTILNTILDDHNLSFSVFTECINELELEKENFISTVRRNVVDFLNCIAEFERQREKKILISVVQGHVVNFLEDNNLAIDVNMVRDTLQGSNYFRPLLESVRFLVGTEDRCRRSCGQRYSKWRREFLEECLSKCGLQEVNNPETWNKASIVVVKILFPNERTLCDLVFQGFPDSSLVDDTYNEICKDLTVRILKSADSWAMASGSNVQNIMYLIQTFNKLYPNSQSLLDDPYIPVLVKNEVPRIQMKLRKALRGKIMELEKLISFDMTKEEVPEKGEIHPITREVMDYLSVFNDRLLFPIFDSTIQLLERKLEEIKHRSYQDPALGYVFLINNLRYITYKVQKCELRPLLGAPWFKRNEVRVKHSDDIHQRLPNNLGRLLLVTDEMN
ncbi:hypothetical protein RJT34_27468 [Clitoria ternatea]